MQDLDIVYCCVPPTQGLQVTVTQASRVLAEASNLLVYTEYAQQDLFNLNLVTSIIQLFVTSVCELLYRLYFYQKNIAIEH